MKIKTKEQARRVRHFRIRHKVRGTAERPRMCVYVSNKHLYVQFVDDEAARTLAAVSTLSGPLAKSPPTRDTAKELGRLAAERAKEQGIARVVFDRGGFKYGIRLKAVADAAREGGLEF